MSATILIVDDEVLLRETFAQVLGEEGFVCWTAGNAEEAHAILLARSIDLALLDIRLPGSNGVDLLGWIADVSPQTSSVMVTSYGTLETAVEALRRGAVDYIPKPFDFDEVLLRIKRLLDRRDALREIQVLRRDVQRTYDFANIVGNSVEMRHVFSMVRKVSATLSSVLITGETGTGKELVARAIHHASEETRGGRFVAINCAALPENLLESELFGYMKGAFTGAVAHKVGLIEVAQGGTLFLDELGDMGLAVQAKILRAIETKEIVRLGGTNPIQVRLRFVSATHRDLADLASRGQFREDLLHRIKVVDIQIPPLRERRTDIRLLAHHFMQTLNRELKVHYQGFDRETMAALVAYEWRGNVRELSNVIERAMILGNGRTLEVGDLPPSLSGSSPDPAPDDLREALAQYEALHILRTLRATGGDKVEACARLHIGLSTLYRRIGELGIREEVDALEAGHSEAGEPGAPPRADRPV